jgi:translation elongation factor EF-4
VQVVSGTLHLNQALLSFATNKTYYSASLELMRPGARIPVQRLAAGQVRPRRRERA